MPPLGLSHFEPSSPQYASSTAKPGDPTAKCPVSLIAAFCAGLHPSLVSMAEPLVGAGVRSLAALATLRSLSPQQLDRFLTELYKECVQRCVHAPALQPLAREHVDHFARCMRA